MEGGDHRDEGGNGRFTAFDKAVEGVKLKVTVACSENAPGKGLRHVRRDGRVEGSHGGKLAGEHCFTLSSRCNLRHSISQA